MNALDVVNERAESISRSRRDGHALRILHVVPRLRSGGGEMFLNLLVRKLDPRACYSSIGALAGRGDGEETAMCPVTWLGYEGSLRDLVGIRRAVCGIRLCIERDQIDVVHSHLWPAARIAGLAVRGRAVRHLVQIQDTWPWLAARDTRSRFLRFFTRAVLAGQQVRYVAVSQAAKDYSCTNLRIPPEHVTVIPNGVDLDQFGISGERPTRQRADGRLVVGMVARFSAEKGHRWLIGAAALLARGGLDFELHLAGDGGLRAECERQAEALGLRERVAFLGAVPHEQIPAFLAGIDLFVLPSEREGLPITLLEAMAVGVPAVASAVAGIPEVVSHGHNGLLVPPGDPAALAAAIHTLSDDSLRQHFGQAAMIAVRSRFSMDAIARQIEHLYARLAAGEA